MRLFSIAFATAALLATPLARAEVTASSPSSFTIHSEADVASLPQEAWRDLTRIDRWWNSAHTYSGDASNLRLDARAGGCWCERWGNGQSVEHMRVVAVIEHEGTRTLRLIGGLGPLQEMGVTGVMTFTVAPLPNGAKITMDYSVSGDSGRALNSIATPVDSVLMEQFGRLTRYTGSGTPD